MTEPDASGGSPSRRAAARGTWLCFAGGLALSLLMLVRSQVGGDQLNLLARGWLLAVHGVWVPFGNPLSTGGMAPGGATSLLAALPLLLWRDHHAATLLVLACHVCSFLLLDRILGRILAPHERLLFALLYWLSPWRLYFSAFLWNPNYLHLFAALHLATAHALRRQARFWASLAHVAALLLALQLHPSSLLLVFASALLWLRGGLKLHPAGAALGFAAGNLPLLPWYAAVASHPALLAQAHKGFPGRGLLLVFPLLRGLLYWLRYSSLSLAGRMTDFDFTAPFGAGANRWLLPACFVLTEVIAPLTVVPPFFANWFLARRRRRRPLRPLRPEAPSRLWLQDYVLAVLGATVLVLCLSPTTFMYWQGLVLVPAAVLPMVFWLGALLRGRSRRCAAWARRGVAVYASLAAALGLALAFGSPDYRCAGRETVVFPLRYDSPMLHELGIQRTCPWPTGDPKGWWPDALPRPGETPASIVGALEGGRKPG